MTNAEPHSPPVMLQSSLGGQGSLWHSAGASLGHGGVTERSLRGEMSPPSQARPPALSQHGFAPKGTGSYQEQPQLQRS